METNTKSDTKAKIKEFLPKISKLIDAHPEYQYPPYFKAKLLLALGDDENVLSAFIPFARQKRNDFWVWEIMAELFPEDQAKQFSFYSKALSLKTLEDFLVKLRQTFAELLITRKMYPEARTEIDKVISTRSKHGWRLPSQIKNWTEQEWYRATKPYNDNHKLYMKYAGGAEDVLFQDIPEEVVAVEYVNESKKILNFVQSKEKHGFFKYSALDGKPKVGDVLKVRFDIYQQDGFCKIFTVKVADSDANCEAIKTFKGEIKIIPPHNIGFVEDVFVEPRIVNASKLTDKQKVSGKAILSFNKKKNVWGWKAFKIL